MKFERITLTDWRQYSQIEIDFHPHLTIITGANGAGKSTLLNILSQHFGWHNPLLATPTVSPDSGKISYFTGLFRQLFNTKENVIPNIIGKITYNNNINSPLAIPENCGVSYQVQIHNQQPIDGLHISSHRQIQNYQQITNIPINAITAESAYNTYQSEIKNRYHGGHSQYSSIYRMKEAIISMATFGAGNQYVQKNPEAEKLFVDFKNVLSKILPPTVGFLNINIRLPDVVVVTESGEFIIDAASGGLMALIDLAWQIFLFSNGKNKFTITIDEPENHLHPSMQRSLLGRLIEAFPNAQFIVVTHSPFMVSSVKDSFVYALKYDDSDENEILESSIHRRISSVKLDAVNRAASASKILRDVLGVPVTIPEWAESDLQKIVSNFSIQNLNPESLNQLRTQLEEAGLGEYYPDALKIMTV